MRGQRRSYRAGPTLLSLRGRLTAEEVPGSSEAIRGQRRSYVAGQPRTTLREIHLRTASIDYQLVAPSRLRR